MPTIDYARITTALIALCLSVLISGLAPSDAGAEPAPDPDETATAPSRG